MQKVVIWGASGHALVVADILQLGNEYAVEGFIDSLEPQRRGTAFGGATILGGQEQLSELLNAGVSLLALGIGDCAARLKLGATAQTMGFKLVTAIHPAAVVAASASIGEGSVLCAGSIVNPAAELGSSVIINTGACVDHECVLGDGVHIAPGAHLAGSVNVGRGTMLGVGCSVRDNVTIGSECMVGAGAVVLDDLPSGVVAYGVPARVIHKIH